MVALRRRHLSPSLVGLSLCRLRKDWQSLQGPLLVRNAPLGFDTDRLSEQSGGRNIRLFLEEVLRNSGYHPPALDPAVPRRAELCSRRHRSNSDAELVRRHEQIMRTASGDPHAAGPSPIRQRTPAMQSPRTSTSPPAPGHQPRHQQQPRLRRPQTSAPKRPGASLLQGTLEMRSVLNCRQHAPQLVCCFS